MLEAPFIYSYWGSGTMATIGLSVSCLWQQDQQEVGTDCGTLPLSRKQKLEYGKMMAVLPVHLSVMMPRFSGRPCFLQGAFPDANLLTPVPSAVSTQPSVSLPGFILSTPGFSIQPSPALEGSCPRQGCPPLIPKEVLGWAALRLLEPMLANRGDLHLTRKWTRSGGSPSQCPWRPKKPAVGERGYNVRFSSCMPLNNDNLLLGILGFFSRCSQLWISLLLSLQAAFSQSTVVSSLGP